MAARKAEVIITCDGAQAKQVLEGINRELQKAIKEREQLLNKQKQNGTLTQDEIKRDRELKKYIDSLTTAQQKSAQEMKKYADVMKDLAGSKTKDLKKALGEVKRALDNMSAKDPKRAQLVADLKRIQTQIDTNTGALKKQQSAWGSLGTTIKNLFAYAGIFAGFNKLKSLVEGVFKANLKLSDSLADIRKVSGLTMGEINQLYRNIAKIDTRNTVETLNQLAYTGAKLGIGQYGVSGLTGFVKAAEQVQMALGEDLGQEALPALAKLTEVMGIINNYGVEQAMQKTASAIFQLGATSTATGKNIVEFSKRLMGLANVSNVSADELLALGSAADAMGLMPEVAATAFNKLFTSLQKNHNLIEQSLGIDPGTINNLYQQGKTMEAMVTIFERMNETGNMNALGGVFKDLGSDGARLVNVMATMADRVDILKKHLKTSTEAFKEGEAVIAEYMIQNETAAAMMERASNIWIKAFTNPEGVDMVKQMADEWYRLSKQMTENQTVMYSLRTAIEGIALAIETLVKLLPFLLHMLTFMGVLATVRSLYFGFTSLVTAIRTATTAQIAFNAAAKSNIVLAMVSAVAALAAVWYESSKAAEEAAEREAERQAELQQAYQTSKAAIEDSVRPLRTFKKVMDEANLSEKEKMQLVKDFKGDYQDYLDYLGIEVNTVDDLASAYADVVKVMKQKRAYEERENYRENVNGSNKMDRIAAGAEVERELRKMGAEGVDKNWILSQRDSKGLGTTAIYNAIMRQTYGTGAVEIKGVGRGRWQAPDSQGKMREVTNQALWRAVNEYLTSHDAEKALNQTVDEMFKDDVGDFDLDKWNEDRMKARLKRRGGLDNLKPDKDAEKALKKAEAEHKQALRKELQDAQRDSDAIMSKIEEWYRLQETVITGFAADGKWTQKQADIMIDQLNMAKNRALADARRGISGRDEKSWEVTKKEIGQLMFDTSDMSQHLLDDILKVKLENVRTALGNIDKAGVEGISSTAMRDRLNKNAAGNDREVQRILKKSAAEVEKMLKQYDFLQQALDAFDNRLTQMGLLTESAAAAARRIQQAENGNPVEALKPGYKAPATEAEVQQQRRKGIETAATKFIQGGAQSMSVNYEDSVELDSWLRELTEATVSMGAKGQEFHFASWAEAFKEDFDKWLRNSKEYKSEIQAFFLSLVQMSDDYTEATKKAYEREKKLQDQRFQLAGYKTVEERTDTSLELQGKMQSAMGSGQNFWQQNGLADTIQSDPEILRIENRIKYRNLEYADAKAHLDRMIGLQQQELQAAKDKGASEEQIASMLEQQRQARAGLEELTYQRQTELLSATADLAAKVSQEVAERAAKIQELSQPVAEFAENAGQKLGDMMFNMESQSMTWNQIWKSMVLSLAQATVKMGAQWLTQKIQQALFYKQMEADEALHQSIMTMIAIGGATARMEGEAAINATSLATNASINSAKVGQEVSMATILTMLGISEGAAKIIGTLGWWGIPLIAVISSLLLGLLASALSTAGQESAATSGGAANRKIKLASGMLTYDEGNISTVVGDDGRVYRAREQQSLPSGVSIVSEPIATRVNGQQALVGERGPEIVIGRKTTRAIQMNRPDLLRDLMLIDRGITTRKVRTFDEGNLSDLASALQPAAAEPQPQSQQQTLDQATIESLRMLPAAMRSFSQMMAAIQQQGIPAEVQMFDTGGKKGLRTQLKAADKMMSRYEGK